MTPEVIFTLLVGRKLHLFIWGNVETGPSSVICWGLPGQLQVYFTAFRNPGQLQQQNNPAWLLSCNSGLSPNIYSEFHIGQARLRTCDKVKPGLSNVNKFSQLSSTDYKLDDIFMNPGKENVSTLRPASNSY